jgi:hypothetical protein
VTAHEVNPMTAHELARVLAAGPDGVVLMSTELGPAGIFDVQFDADPKGPIVYLIEDQS